MPLHRSAQRTHPVGIDLGTTYSCLSTLTPEGRPLTLPNTEGELATPSVVFFDGQEIVVGTEALRNSVAQPERVVMHAKRFMGDPNKCWVFDGRVYRPMEISALILRKLLDGAQERLGPIRHAVITVPAQFSDVQRKLTVEAGLNAGLDRVDIINEPVATAMCHVLGEGMWFAEIANDQTVFVFDLGGGTFDLSLVRYNKDEVKVIASGGDLRLGGLDWNKRLEEFACDEFSRTSSSDPRLDLESMQAISIEVEQVKRSLSVRPQATLMVQHDGRRKSFLMTRDRFELLAADLVQRTEDITKGMLKAHQLGWAHVDAVLVTGGASRMPMIRNMLQRISGTTLNTTLSPDQSISHGAAFYAGMLLSGKSIENSTLDTSTTARLQSFRQQSVTGRALGILIRDPQTDELRPHYLIPANTPLPCAYRQTFGTVKENQKRVHLHIVESGATQGEEYVELGDCQIDDLPAKLPLRSPIEVTIRYDIQGRVTVTATDTTSGNAVRVAIVREQPDIDVTPEETEESDLAPAVAADAREESSPLPPPPLPTPQRGSNEAAADAFEADLARVEERRPTRSAANSAADASSPASTAEVASKKSTKPKSRSRRKPPKVTTNVSLEDAERPIPLCNECGNALDKNGSCTDCSPAKRTRKRRPPPSPQNSEAPPTSAGRRKGSRNKSH